MIFRALIVGLLLLPTVTIAAEMPRGYYAKLEISVDGQRLIFGPFVGYYFKPVHGNDLKKLTFRCYNERQFYTDQLPAGTLLFTGEAQFRSLPQVRDLPPRNARIEPVFFGNAPQQWLQTRPAPKNEFVHFHSTYNAAGPSYKGYWLRHQPATSFIYNMGGRIDQDSPLYHQAEPGAGQRFPHIIEFDAGPGPY